MDRRDFITKSSALAAAAMVAPSFAFAAENKSESGNALLDTATDCLKKGDLCLQHCIESLSTGSKAMAACAASVREMQVACEALAKASAQKSKHLKAYAKIAMDACKDCDAECRKHKMEVCQVCADACVECAKACKTA